MPTTIIEGTVILENLGGCDDFINILLRNGYKLTIKLIDDNRNMKIYYIKED